MPCQRNACGTLYILHVQAGWYSSKRFGDHMGLVSSCG